MELLAHRPGGIPVALSQKPWLIPMVIPLLMAMCVSLLLHARKKQSLVIHANWGISGCIAGIVGMFIKCPVVTTLRGEDYSRGRISRVDGYILKLALRLSSAVVTVSDAMRISLLDSYPEYAKKLHHIPNGVNEQFLSVAKKRQYSDNSSEPLRLITIGSLIPRKGIEQIIDALSLVGNEVQLTIVGDGPEKPRLQLLTNKLNLEHRVFFKGEVEPSSVEQYLLNADVFILSSHNEGRPNVILEAFASGLPVIATAIDGVNELIQEKVTGFLFKDGEIHELAKHIEHFSEQRHQCEKFGQNAHQFIIKQGLSWQHTANSYQSLYSSLLKRTD